MNRKTNSKSGLSLNKGSGQTNNLPESVKTTPTRDNSTEEDSFNSPLFSQYSQEEYEFCDVIWNWNSAQVKPRPRKHKKLEFAESPKLTIKRHPSNNQITDFKRLQEELEGLTCDFLNSNSNSKQDLSSNTNKPVIEPENIFDDSMEDQLLMCSQEIERRINMDTYEDSKLEIAQQHDHISPTSLHDVTDLAINSTDTNKMKLTDTLTQLDDTLEVANDTLDNYLQDMQEQNLKFWSRNRELYDVEPNMHKTTDKTTTIDEEIERKRQEALKKLESKKKQAQDSSEKDSPIKCSPEEIEKKRLQALAKLQTKRKLEMIERNRLEAIKRLELNKKKRAM